MTTGMHADSAQASERPSARPLKIGLALSGGGFRASIFHLGVIRRLEELGIMKDVAVISAVSGGSIIAAYYVIEMEDRLRARRSENQQTPQSIDSIRLKIFEEIAADFLTALDHNLRTRAMIFSPFYHTFKWVRTLWPGYSRSDLMQTEYDRWFYKGNSLDQLPSVTGESRQEQHSLLAGPKLILNTTSLMTGKRVGFSREPVSGFNELKQVNTNVLKLSRIVGASSAVPGLFPPTSVSGDLLVDGGVADNQGITGLVGSDIDRGSKDDSDSGENLDDFDILLVSDASGQFEQAHRMSLKALPVLNRTTSILQFQVRNKQLDMLINWKINGSKGNERTVKDREFAFVHLFLNLKDRRVNGGDVPRLPEEYIAGLGRIRTDLDQFSLIERESLMYHGYTLIDAQIQMHCQSLYHHATSDEGGIPSLRQPPLFRSCSSIPSPGDESSETNASESAPNDRLKRKLIKKELESGKIRVFLFRAVKRHGFKAFLAMIFTWLIPVLALYLLGIHPYLKEITDLLVEPYLYPVFESVIPEWLLLLFPNIGFYFSWPITTTGFTVLVSLVFLIYFLGFATYIIMRRLVRQWGLVVYKRLTGVENPSTKW